MTDTLAAAFDTKLQETIRKESSFSDAFMSTVITVHKQLVEEGIVSDNATTFLQLYSGMAELMALSDETAQALLGKPNPHEVRERQIGKFAAMSLDRARRRKKEIDREKKLKASLPEGVSMPEGGS